MNFLNTFSDDKFIMRINHPANYRLLVFPLLILLSVNHHKAAAEPPTFAATRWNAGEVHEQANGIYDRNWKKVTITYSKNGRLSFSANASTELQMLASAVAKTSIGMNTLRSMNSSESKITIEIDTSTVITTNEGSFLAAETSPIISTPVNSKAKPVARMFISKAKIVIYRAAINDIASKNDGKMKINGVVFSLKEFSLSDIIASYCIHEFVHVLDSRFSGALNPKATRAEIEQKPYAYQLMHLKELQQQVNK